MVFATASDELKKAFDTDADKVRLNAETLATHFKHEDITPFDYALIRRLLNDENAKIEKGNKDRHIVYFSKYGVDYKAVLKTTEKDEIYLVSLITIKRSKAK